MCFALIQSILSRMKLNVAHTKYMNKIATRCGQVTTALRKKLTHV